MQETESILVCVAKNFMYACVYICIGWGACISSGQCRPYNQGYCMLEDHNRRIHVLAALRAMMVTPKKTKIASKCFMGKILPGVKQRDTGVDVIYVV